MVEPLHHYGSNLDQSDHKAEHTHKNFTLERPQIEH
jgi:hypothetical protein